MVKMLLSVFLFALLCCCGGAYPRNPWFGNGAFAGPFGAFAGVGAGAGGFFNYPMQIPSVEPSYGYGPYGFPFPFFVPSIPWYKGPNVCVEKKYINEPKELEDLNNDPDFKEFNFHQQSETCRGSNTKYVCYGRTSANQGMKMYITKSQCCHGFIRSEDGPGCVENAAEESTVTPQEPMRMDASTRYDFVQQQRTIAPSKSSFGVEKVAVA